MTIRDEIIAQARARQGIPYSLDPPPDGVNNLDCSLFVLQVAKAAGVPLPSGVRTAEQIRQATVPIPFSDVLPGDLVFFEYTYDAAGPAGPDGRIASHIGISLGDGTRRMWDANDANGVGETNIGTPYWQERIFEARRLPALVTAALPSVPGPVETLRGIDVASYQGDPDWAAVAASGVAFAITKITEDEGYLNPTFARNWREIKRAGMVRGAYHFARPEGTDAVEEADWFVDQIEAHGGMADGDLLALDLESGSGDLGAWSLDFLSRVESRTGITPLVYTGAWFTATFNVRGSPGLARYPLWLAAYQASQPSPPEPWASVAMWQFTDNGAVAGISGPVDLNRFNGSREQLLALGKGGTVVSPQPVADPRDAQIAGLVTAVAHLADVVAAIEDRPARLAEALAIREQFVGPRPAA